MSTKVRSAIAFPIALLSVLGILTAWINYTVQPPAPKLDGSSRHDPDYIVSNFVTTQTDINGQLRYQLAAAEMKHFPDNDGTDLIKPRYTQYTVGKPYTRVEGMQGQVSSNGERIQLSKQVKVTRQAFAEKGEMTVETEYLDILPNQDLVKTDHPVVIKQAPKTVIYATGMIYEKNKKTVTLLHKVRAHYEQPNIKNKRAKKAGKTANSTSSNNVTATTEKNLTLQEPVNSNTNNTRIRRRYE
ncbi:MAG TPA: LPS export ABC transporter periplasmic protein LptC [Methylotenera sp.]|nr:LPS export ABC transporter periplasmic protein LptC [Methylotenera sp.]HPH06204.1 LPS export ABC transporter periplasmic protein LptC [Methylotenera sp.]HPN00996.1 LPS export ABC transporter periplasmic protein LptC [Methylotenera sp.]